MRQPPCLERERPDCCLRHRLEATSTLRGHLKPYPPARSDEMSPGRGLAFLKLCHSPFLAALPFPGFPPLVTEEPGMAQPHPNTDTQAACLQSKLNRYTAWFKFKIRTYWNWPKQKENLIACVAELPTIQGPVSPNLSLSSLPFSSPPPPPCIPRHTHFMVP